MSKIESPTNAARPPPDRSIIAWIGRNEGVPQPTLNAALQRLIDQQRAAADSDDAQLFHRLDEEFHRAICANSGHDYVWDLIHDHKAHMDRVRMLSLSSTSQKLALREHIAILAAIADRDAAAATEAMTRHLSRIEALIEQIKAQNHDWFVDTSA